MKKRIAALLAAASLLALLSGCSARPLPDGMDEDSCGKAGQAIVDLLLAGDYQGVADAFDADIRTSLNVTAELIETSLSPIWEGAGEYVSTYQIMAVGGQSKNYSGDYATVGIYCEHEEVDIVYEMSFDTDLELIGLDAKQQRKSLFG